MISGVAHDWMFYDVHTQSSLGCSFANPEIATSGAYSALIWQCPWKGVTVFRGCTSLVEVSEDSIMSSVYRSRSGMTGMASSVRSVKKDHTSLFYTYKLTR